MSSHPLRVAQLLPSLVLGGATRIALDVAVGLRAAGYEVEIIAGTEAPPGPTMAGVIADLQLPLHQLPRLRRDPHPLDDRAALGDLTRLFQAREYAVVHTHGIKARLLGGWAARRAGVPQVIWHVHGWGFEERGAGLGHTALALAHRYGARWATAIVPVSEATRQAGLAWGIGRPERTRVIYEAVDLPRFTGVTLTMAEAKARLGLAPETLVIGSLTRLAEQKAPLDLIDAAAYVLAEYPEARFVIAGDGPLQAATERRVAAHGLQDKIMLLGARWDAPEVLAAFDVFALSSLWEGFPIAYLEAMAMGKPVVGTDVGGAAECVHEGRTGFFVPPHHPRLLAERIVTLLAQPSLRARLGTAGKAVAQQYGVDRLQREFVALYQELLTEGER